MTTISTQECILILNGSHAEIPLIEAAKKLGYFVITTGNLPELIGHQYSDLYIQEDYSQKDKILALAKENNITAICSCANDLGAITASYVAEKMQLSGHDSYQTTVLLHQKDLFKDFALAEGIKTPYAEKYNSITQALARESKYQYPLIIKPVDMTGGKGVAIVESQSNYKTAIERAFEYSIVKRVVIEEFFQGTQHSLSTFIVNQQVQFSYSDNEYSYLNPYFVSTSSAPAQNIERYRSALVEDIEKMAEKLKLEDGIFHIQFLANGAEATIIDITRRCSGDLYPYPVNYATLVDWAEWIVKAEAGIDCSDFPKLQQSGFYGRHCIMSDNNGIVQDVVISKQLRPYIIDEIFWWHSGDIIDDYLSQKVGMVFMRYESDLEMKEMTLKLNQLIKVELVD